MAAPPLDAAVEPPPGRVEGLVEDAAGRPMARAAVQLRAEGQDGGPTRDSGADGRFVFESVARGRYRLSVTKPPVAVRLEEAIEVGEAQTVQVRVALVFVDIHDTVEVLAERDPLDPLRVFPGSTASEDEVESTPAAARGPGPVNATGAQIVRCPSTSRARRRTVSRFERLNG